MAVVLVTLLNWLRFPREWRQFTPPVLERFWTQPWIDEDSMSKFDFVYVLGGVYMRTATGELIGRLDQPGSPFRTLDEARENAVWLGRMLDLEQSKHRGEREVSGVHNPSASELKWV